MKKCRIEERKLYVADFETTVEENTAAQTETEVWAAGICPVKEKLSEDDVTIYNNIFDFINHLEYHIEDDSIVFFHNAKFDLSFLIGSLETCGFHAAWSWDKENHYAEDWQQNMMPNTYKVSVNKMGLWYGARICFEGKTVEIRDSAKKLPLTLEQIGKSFDTKYKKLTMEYVDSDTVHHKAFQPIPENEYKYLCNDCLCLAEAIYIIWYKYGMTGITIGSDCLKEFKALKGKEFDILFPDMANFWLDDIGCDEHISAYDYCLKAYSGGWVYQNEMSKGVLFKSDIKWPEELQRKFNKLASKNAKVVEVKNICVADVNSLYPSVQSSESGSYYPVGYPEYRKGHPKRSEIKNYAIFRRFKCRFKLKKGYLPFMHIRDDVAYNSTECLKTSDVYGKRFYKTRDGEEHDTLRTYTLTQPEFELFEKHYEILNYEPIDYLIFEKQVGIFDDYIHKYRDMKIQAKKDGNKGLYTISKLYANNLYGKMSQTTDSSFKTIHFEDGVMKFDTNIEHEKDPIYIPAGAYITAHARRFTITASQSNYYEGEYRGIQYADTDSMHLVDLNPDEIKGVEYHATDFCKWDCEESSCAYAIYAKLKTYIEISCESSFEKITDKEGNPDFKVIAKAAGLSKEGKKIFTDRLFLDKDDENKVYLDQFQPGLCIENANLKARQVKGGIVLTPSEFKLS